MYSDMIGQIVRECCRRARLIVLAGVALGFATGMYSANHFSMNTDTEALLSSQLRWRQREISYDKAFPQQSDLIAIVIDGKTPELAEQAAALLAENLSRQPDHFRSVLRPDGGEFFDRNGLLFLSPGEAQTTIDDLIKAQPFLSTLALDPSLHGIISSLSNALTGVEHKETRLEDLEKPISAFSDAFAGVEKGGRYFFFLAQPVAGWKDQPPGNPAVHYRAAHS